MNQELIWAAKLNLKFHHRALLQEGMIVRGEIVLASDSGHNYHIEVKLIAGGQRINY